MPTQIVLQDAFKTATHDQDKIITPEETVRRFHAKASKLSLSILKETRRIDNGRLDIPVYFSVCGEDAQRLTGTAKQMGKGANPAQSQASAVMELVERFSFFAFKDEKSHFDVATWEEAKGEKIPFEMMASSVHDEETPLKDVKTILKGIPFSWTSAWNLTQNREVLLPFDWFYAINEFNGPSAGNCAEEAICQGISEVVERHVCSIIGHKKRPTPTLDPKTSTDPAVLEMISKYEKNGIRLVVSDFSLDTGIPTVGVFAWDPESFPHSSELVWTAGTAPDPQKALSRALTEVAQLAGDFNTCANYVASGLPKFTELSEASFLTADTEKKGVDSLPDLASDNIRNEIERMVKALKGIGMEVLLVETTHQGLGIPAFYTVIPGAHFRERSLGTSVPMFAAKLILQKFSPLEAISRIQAIEEIVGERFYLHFYKGQALLELGMHERALSAFETAMNTDPKPQEIPSICSWTGVCLKELGEYKKALNVLAQGIDLDPEREDIYNLMGFCHYMLCQHEEAIDAFREVLRLNPNSAIDYANIASNYRELGQKEKAISYYKMALSMDDSIGFARENLVRLTESGATA